VDLNSEIKLVGNAQQGCIDSFGILYERYYKAMNAIALAILTDKELAEDAAQEAFAIACKDIGNLKNKDKFAPWLAGICRNVSRQMLKTNKIKLNSSIVECISSQKDEHSQKQAAIKNALGNLKDSERELINLRYYDNLPYERIASVLHISTQAVHGRLIRTKRKIAKHLKRNGVTGDDYE